MPAKNDLKKLENKTCFIVEKNGKMRLTFIQNECILTL